MFRLNFFDTLELCLHSPLTLLCFALFSTDICPRNCNVCSCNNSRNSSSEWCVLVALWAVHLVTPFWFVVLSTMFMLTDEHFEMQELSDVSIISKAGGTWVQCLVLNVLGTSQTRPQLYCLNSFLRKVTIAHSISHMRVSCLHEFYWCHHRSICCHFIRDRSQSPGSHQCWLFHISWSVNSTCFGLNLVSTD